MAAKVEVKALVKRYGPVEAVRGLSFEVREGEIFGLLGPNGAGKTTTLECVVGLRRPDGGSVSVCGFDALEQVAEIKQRIGVQLQATALQESITVREALKLFASFYRRKADVPGLMERFMLAGQMDARFETLSGGQKQRLAVALALLNNPEVLFLDEPTAAMDAQSRRELHGIIREMREKGRTVVLTTHYIEEAEQLCDRIAIVDHGRVIAEGTPGELVERAKGLVKMWVKTERGMEAEKVRGLGGVKEVRAEGTGGVEIRTEHVGRTVVELVRMLEAEGNELVDLNIRRASLEDVFIELTGRGMRD